MTNKYNLTGKVAVVTGAASALGMEAAKAYARAGADLALISEDVQGLFELKIEIENLGRRAFAVQCVLTDETQVKAAVGKILGEFGKIDILFNNSSMALRDGLEAMTEDDWSRTFGEALTGVYMAGKYVIPAMKLAGSGRIINISSASSRIPADNGRWAISPTDKVADLTKLLAKLYASYGIIINTVAPEKVMQSTLGLEGTILGLSTDELPLIRGQFIGSRHANIA